MPPHYPPSPLLLPRDLEHIAAPVYSAKAHDVIVNAIDGCGGLGIGGGAPELVTGSRDGEIVMIAYDTHMHCKRCNASKLAPLLPQAV